MAASQRYAVHRRPEPFHPVTCCKCCKNHPRTHRSSVDIARFQATMLSLKVNTQPSSIPPSRSRVIQKDFSREIVPSPPDACFLETVVDWMSHLGKAVGSHAADEVWTRIDGRRTHAHQLGRLLLVVHVLPGHWAAIVRVSPISSAVIKMPLHACHRYLTIIRG
jgi:hypothetical protein